MKQDLISRMIENWTEGQLITILWDTLGTPKGISSMTHQVGPSLKWVCQVH